MAFAKVGSVGFGSSAGAATSQGYAIASTTAGNLLTVNAVVGGNTTMTISDNGASHATWVQILATTFDATGNFTEAAWVAYNIPSGITTVTVTYGASSSPRAGFVQEWSGGATTSAFDQGPGRLTQTSATPASSSVTPSQDNELVIGACWSLGGNAVTQGGSFTTLANSTTGFQWRSEYVIQTTAIAVAPNYTCTSQYVIADVFTFATSPVSPPGGDTVTIDTAHTGGFQPTMAM